MFTYSAYGLDIASALPLPELVSTVPATEPDVVIREGQVDRSPAKTDGSLYGCFHATPEEAYLFYQPIGKLLVRRGREIILDLVSDVEPSVLRHILLGVATGILLHQRGHVTLHASAVSIHGQVAAFIGWKGMGKSTTAAALYAHGHPLITDDTVVLSNTDAATVLPGFPQLKLRPEAVAASLGLDPEALPHLGFERRLRRADEGFSLSPLPLKHIYVLDWNERLGVDRLSDKEAFLQLITHSYALRFLGNVGATAHHFSQIERLVLQVPVFRLRKPRSLSHLSDLVRYVESHTHRPASEYEPA